MARTRKLLATMNVPFFLQQTPGKEEAEVICWLLTTIVLFAGSSMELQSIRMRRSNWKFEGFQSVMGYRGYLVIGSPCLGVYEKRQVTLSQRLPNLEGWHTKKGQSGTMTSTSIPSPILSRFYRLFENETLPEN